MASATVKRRLLGAAIGVVVTCGGPPPAPASAETANAFPTLNCTQGDFVWKQCWRGNATGLLASRTYSYWLTLQSEGRLVDDVERNGFSGVTFVSTPSMRTNYIDGGDFEREYCVTMRIYRGNGRTNLIDSDRVCK